MFMRLLSVSVAGVLTSAALAQYSRVEDGRANDASLRVGSGGYNAQYKPNAPRYGDQVMSGNITGGKSFRGYSPVSSTTDFGFTQNTTGISALDNFRRDSVGVDDGRSGNPSYMARPWYSPTQTVLSTGSDRVGFRPSGLPQLPQDYLNLPKSPLDQTGGQAGRSASEIRTYQRSDLPGLSRLEDASNYANSRLPQTRSELFGVAPDPSRANVDLRRESGLPGFQGPSGSVSRLTNLRTLAPGEAPQGTGEAGTAESATGAGTLPGSTSFFGGAARAPGGPPDLPDQRPKPFGQEVTASQPWGGYAQPTPLPESTGRTVPLTDITAARAGKLTESADVYRAMLSKLTPIVPPAESGAGAAVAPPAEQTAGARARQLEAAVPPAGSRVPALKAQVERERAALEEPVVTFVGNEKTLSNRAFARAEEQLRTGKYYDAVTSYDIARSADPENPLIWIGRGHALIGAGDYLSAVTSLEEGISRFPGITRFKLDLRKFLSNRDILDVRRADLERRLEEKDDYRLRFLLGYMEYYSGLEKFGLENLNKAAKAAPTTSPISSLPELLSKR
jgi:hypothetical protein